MEKDSGSSQRQAFFETLNELNIRMALLAASDLADFMSRILNMVNRLGFAECSFTRLFSESNPDAHLVTTHRNIIDHYRSRDVWDHDMMIGAARNNVGARFQSDLDRFVLSAPADTDAILSNKISIKLKHSLNYYEYIGVALPARNNNGNILMAIQSPNMPVSEFRIRAESCMPSLHILAAAIDHVGTKKYPEFFLGPKESRAITINPKPLQLLTKIASECNDPAVPAHLKPLMHTPQRASSSRAPDAVVGCCRT